MSFFVCPLPSAIADILTDECVERVGQIQKIIIQRTGNGGIVNQHDIATLNPNTLAAWTPLKTASDSTKIIVTPLTQEVNIEVGTVREYGGDNTVGRTPIQLGSTPSKFDCKFFDAKQKVIASMKETVNNPKDKLSFFLINEHGQIIGQTDNLITPTKFKGIAAIGRFLGDKKLGNGNEPDANTFNWSFAENWSDTLHVVTPVDFDALTEL